jgi:hypothetical protein
MGPHDVEPLEDRAYVTIDVTEDGYLRIDQSVGDPPMYTPAEARELAEDIVTAADRAQARPNDE